MKIRPVGAGLAIVLATCACSTTRDTAPDPAVVPPPATAGPDLTDTSSHVADSTSPTVRAAADDGCGRAPTTALDEAGTVHTIVPGRDQDDVVVELLPEMSVVCAGAVFGVEVRVDNTSPRTVVFEPARGLILSGAMPKWSIAGIESFAVEPGVTESFVVDVTVPHVAPGAYWITAEGYLGAASITVVDRP